MEPEAVKNAVVNAQSRKDIDVLVLATNAHYSNATKDWVKEWQTSRPRPRVRLWDRNHLERLIIKHPSVAARLFSDSLSDQGKLEACRSRLWNQMYFPSRGDLEQFWARRATLQWSADAILAVVWSECINGDITLRPWLVMFDEDVLKSVFITCLWKLPYLVVRAYRFGINPDLIIRGTAYVTLCAVHRLPNDFVAGFLDNPWLNEESQSKLDGYRKFFLKPILGRLLAELEDVCTSDCSRLHPDNQILTEEEVASYWNRLRMPAKESAIEPEEKSYRLIIENLEAPCKAGLNLVKEQEQTCPIVRFKPEDDIKSIVQTLKAIITGRVGPYAVSSRS